MNLFITSTLLAFAVTINLLNNPCSAEVVKLNEDNFYTTLATYPVVLVTFYADWCPHSRNLLKTYEEGADEITAKFPNNGNTTMVKVNCEDDKPICRRYDIKRYPTLKIIMNETKVFKYRGDWDLDQIFDFVDEHLGYVEGDGSDFEEDYEIITNEPTETTTDDTSGYAKDFSNLLASFRDHQPYANANSNRAGCLAAFLLLIHCLNL